MASSQPGVTAEVAGVAAALVGCDPPAQPSVSPCWDVAAAGDSTQTSLWEKCVVLQTKKKKKDSDFIVSRTKGLAHCTNVAQS